MTDPKRMTTERIAEIQHLLSIGMDNPSRKVEELLHALSAERTHSAKVEAEREALRTKHITWSASGWAQCQLCESKEWRWREGEPESHAVDCIAAPAEKT